MHNGITERMTEKGTGKKVFGGVRGKMAEE